MKYLIVVDMQNDFVNGSLGTSEAASVVLNVEKRIADAIARGEKVIFTKDTHESGYLSTLEGKNLPVQHCIKGSEGWEIIPRLQNYAEGRMIIEKPTFGSTELARMLEKESLSEPVEKVTLIGLCTDICVISNALLLKAFLPQCEIAVDASACAGVTPRSHQNALDAMRACQITIENQ